jgi:hypothetical protein
MRLGTFITLAITSLASPSVADETADAQLVRGLDNGAIGVHRAGTKRANAFVVHRDRSRTTALGLTVAHADARPGDRLSFYGLNGIPVVAEARVESVLATGVKFDERGRQHGQLDYKLVRLRFDPGTAPDPLGVIGDRLPKSGGLAIATRPCSVTGQIGALAATRRRRRRQTHGLRYPPSR